MHPQLLRTSLGIMIIKSFLSHAALTQEVPSRTASASAVEKRFGCWPRCAALGHENYLVEYAGVAPGTPEAAWKVWQSPGGIEVVYLEREDVSLGGGPGFGLDLVRYAYNHFVRDGEMNYGWLPTQPRRCFEFCAGPAFIGFTLLGLGVCTSLVLADVNPASVEAMQRTVARNPNLSGRVQIYHSDALDDIPDAELGAWDLVVSNPPHFIDIVRPNGVVVNQGSSMTVDFDWQLHRRFFRDVGRFLVPGRGRVVMQENMGGSQPETFLPMLTNSALSVVEILPNQAADDGPWKFWYFHLAAPGAAWMQAPRPVPVEGASTPASRCSLTWSSKVSLQAYPRGCLPALRDELSRSSSDIEIYEDHSNNTASNSSRSILYSTALSSWRPPPSLLLSLERDGFAVHSSSGTHSDPRISNGEISRSSEGAAVASSNAVRALRRALVEIIASERPCTTVFGTPQASCRVTDESAVAGHQSFRVWELLHSSVARSNDEDINYKEKYNENETVIRLNTKALVEPFLQSHVVRNTMAALLGPGFQLNGCTAYVASSQSVRENVWHFDFKYQDSRFRAVAAEAAAAESVTSKHTRSNGHAHFAAAMVFLQDTSPSNGATLLIPKSHKWAAQDPPFLPPGRIPEFAEVERLWRDWNASRVSASNGNERKRSTQNGNGADLKATEEQHIDAALPRKEAIEAREGDVLFFHGSTMHATGPFTARAASDKEVTRHENEAIIEVAATRVRSSLAEAEGYRYALVLHFSSQEVALRWASEPPEVQPLEHRYLGGHQRLQLNVEIDGAPPAPVVVSAYDDFYDVSLRFLQARGRCSSGRGQCSADEMRAVEELAQGLKKAANDSGLFL